MGPESRLAGQRHGPVAWLWCAHLGSSLLAILYFSVLVAESTPQVWPLVAFHLLVATPLWLFVFSTCGLLLAFDRVVRSRWLRLGVLLLAASYATAGTVLYLVDVAANRLGGGNVPGLMVGKFLVALVPSWGWPLVAASVVGIATLHVRLFGPAIVAWGGVLVGAVRAQAHLSLPARTAVILALIVVTTGYGLGFAAFWRGSVVPLGLWRNEPLTSFVLLSCSDLDPALRRVLSNHE
jgi:hypothetical protein